MGPTWLLDVLAALMLLTAAYCLGRLVSAAVWGRATHLDVDVAHVAMGLAMAGMFVPSLRSLPPSAWEVVLGAMAVLFAMQVVYFVRHGGLRDWDEDHLHHVSHYATHLAMAVAMLYMLAAFPAGGSGTDGAGNTAAMAASGRTGSGLSVLLAFVLLVAAVWYADSLTRFTRRQPATATANGGDDEAPVQQAAAPAVAVPAVAAPAVGETVGQAVPAPSLALALRGRPRLVGSSVHASRDSRWLAPRLEVTTHIVMCFAMGYMLIVMR